jgi:hypothetical protein
MIRLQQYTLQQYAPVHQTPRALFAMARVQKTWEGSGMQLIAEYQGAVDSRRIQQLATVVTVSTASTATLFAAWLVVETHTTLLLHSVCLLQPQEVHQTLAVGALDQQQAQQVRSNTLVASSAGRSSYCYRVTTNTSQAFIILQSRAPVLMCGMWAVHTSTSGSKTRQHKWGL